MGNYISDMTPHAAGKVLLSDGTVHEYDKPLTVAELMLDHPQQVVVEIQSFAGGKRPCPLPADHTLDKDKVYLMLPMKRGKAASLSSEEARRLLLKANSVLRNGSLLSSSSKFFCLFMCSYPAAWEGHQFGQPKKETLVEKSEEVSKPECFQEFLEGRPEYLSRQISGKGWKPSLDTIEERSLERRVRHWLF